MQAVSQERDQDVRFGPLIGLVDAAAARIHDWEGADLCTADDFDPNDVECLTNLPGGAAIAALAEALEAERVAAYVLPVSRADHCAAQGITEEELADFCEQMHLDMPGAYW